MVQIAPWVQSGRAVLPSMLASSGGWLAAWAAADQAPGTGLSSEWWGLCLLWAPSSLRRAVGTVSMEPCLLGVELMGHC